VKFVVVHAAVVAALASMVAVAPANAEEPILHHVKYTVGASEPMRAEIYYRDVQPPNWAEYSHNPYVFSPNVEADLGPGKPWVLEAMLADPQQWAMVIATTPGHTPALAEPGFVCELRVDDVVVATDSGPKGALCSLRTW
jgi:hypothetical protein